MNLYLAKLTQIVENDLQELCSFEPEENDAQIFEGCVCVYNVGIFEGHKF